jgi:hypothetical protein
MHPVLVHVSSAALHHKRFLVATEPLSRREFFYLFWGNEGMRAEHPLILD